MTSSSQTLNSVVDLNDSGLRPSERVYQYLMMKFAQRDSAENGRLPSVRQIAREVKVSTATVQTVFQKLAEQGRIRSEVGSGTFWTEKQLVEPVAEQVLHFGTNLPLPDAPPPDFWTYRIYGGIMHRILQSPQPIVLRSLSLEALETDVSGQRFQEETRNQDGLILFPGRFSRRLRRLCEREGRPVVDLNPPYETATTNFVSPDYYDASRMLGIAMREAGRKRVAVIVSPPLEESVSVRLRCAGFAAGLGESLGLEIQMRVVTAADRDEETGRRAVQELLIGQFRPDCIYCAGDALAHGALVACQEAGLQVPDEVSVIGGNGLGIGAAADRVLTSTSHPIDLLGSHLVSMLLSRVEFKGGDVPGVYLPPVFNLGESTTSKENTILAQLVERSESGTDSISSTNRSVLT